MKEYPHTDDVKRQRTMSRIKSKNTKIEESLQKALWHLGIRYRKNYKKLPGVPDIAITKHQIAIFCDGEFWHGKDWETKKPKIQSNREYWIPKIERNMARDNEANKSLAEMGWTVLRFWGTDIHKNLDECIEKIKNAIIQNQINSKSRKSKIIDFYNINGIEGSGLRVAEQQHIYSYDEYNSANFGENIDKTKFGIHNDPAIRNFTAVSLFCGAGGLDLGFEQAGFTTLWANDFDIDACKTHCAWSGTNVVCGDISKIDESIIPKTDIILGGFPCQGFSFSGPRKVDDARNRLYKEYVRIVKSKEPAAFIGENVKGLLTMANGEIIKMIIRDFSDCGYDVFCEPVNAKNYGVPQDRERVVIIGFKKDLKIKSFTLPEYNDNAKALSDVLNSLDFDSDEVCDAPFSSRYMSRNRKRGWSEVSYTIPAMAKQVALHPESPDMVKLGTDLWRFGTDGMTRRLSWRECAAIQTFPPAIEFYGDLISKYKQIGNAVPVALAYHVACAVRSILEAKI